jgi:uncharacterized repeat protein (TIGR02543 family)
VQSADAGYTITVTVTRSGNSGSVTSDPTSAVTDSSVTYTVRYNKNADDATGTTADSTHTFDVEKALTANGYTRTGYTFAGWGTWDTRYYGDTTDYTDGQNVKNLTETAGTVFYLYAKWTAITYTVRYDKNASDATGTTADSTHTYDVEKTFTGNGYTRIGYTFTGWNTQANGNGTNYTNGQNVKNLTATSGAVFTLYAVWMTPNDADFGQGASINNTFNVSTTAEWDDAVSTISDGGDDKNYIINVIADFTVTGITTASFGSVTGVTVSLRGTGRTLSLSGNGSILRIAANQTAILRDVTLRGDISNYTSLVYVNGTFIMNGGEITGNTTTPSYYMGDYRGGTNGGGGISVHGGTFIMNGGKISGNTVGNNGKGGGGVNVDGAEDGGGTFTMNGGEISGNTASSGGGVYMQGRTFTMNGGEISGNRAGYGGGGVLCSRGTFTMNGGKISGNTGNSGNGGGVCVYGDTFTMNGGTISGNTASDNGGGVYVYGDTSLSIISMKGGEISGNTARYGGGVYGGAGVYCLGIVNIATGTIYGSGEAESLKNTATSGGAALYLSDRSEASYGTFDSNNYWRSNGDLSSTSNTIRVVNGVLQ